MKFLSQLFLLLFPIGVGNHILMHLAVSQRISQVQSSFLVHLKALEPQNTTLPPFFCAQYAFIGHRFSNSASLFLFYRYRQYKYFRISIFFLQQCSHSKHNGIRFNYNECDCVIHIRFIRHTIVISIHKRYVGFHKELKSYVRAEE